MHKISVITLLFLAVACVNRIPDVAISASDSTNIAAVDTIKPKDTLAYIPADSVVCPFGYALITQVKGNLDIDLKPEMVMVYDTDIKGQLGTKRILKIFKKQDSNWVETAVCQGCILESQAGGVQGDPYQGISIKNKVLTIYHQGGSRQKWAFVHKYQWSNKEFKLIGFTHTDSDPCNYLNTLDVNLKTGLVLNKETIEKCNNKTKKNCFNLKNSFRQKIKNADTVNFDNMNSTWFHDFKLPTK